MAPDCPDTSGYARLQFRLPDVIACLCQEGRHDSLPVVWTEQGHRAAYRGWRTFSARGGSLGNRVPDRGETLDAIDPRALGARYIA